MKPSHRIGPPRPKFIGPWRETADKALELGVKLVYFLYGKVPVRTPARIFTECEPGGRVVRTAVKFQFNPQKADCSWATDHGFFLWKAKM
jgi:hypothetical protein